MIRVALLSLIIFTFSLSPVYSGGMRSPGKKNIQTTSYVSNSSLQKDVALTLISFFSRYISPVDGPRSPSYPTGSAYAKDAIQTHGFFLGIILTADRLIHESDTPLGPMIFLHKKMRFYDPVENNTFWWSESK